MAVSGIIPVIKSFGTCVDCGSKNQILGDGKCVSCYDAHCEKIDYLRRRRYYTRYSRERYWFKRLNGICIECSQPATLGVYCDKHQQVKRERVYINYWQKRLNGICVKCNQLAVFGVHCEKHRNQNNERAFTWYHCLRPQQNAREPSVVKAESAFIEGD